MSPLARASVHVLLLVSLLGSLAFRPGAAIPCYTTAGHTSKNAFIFGQTRSLPQTKDGPEDYFTICLSFPVSGTVTKDGKVQEVSGTDGFGVGAQQADSCASFAAKNYEYHTGLKHCSLGPQGAVDGGGEVASIAAPPTPSWSCCNTPFCNLGLGVHFSAPH